jgi:hypothetical protein
MGDADVISDHSYWEFKHRASSLNSRTRLIEMVPGDSIQTRMLTLVTNKIPFGGDSNGFQGEQAQVC